jgi:hypothetical protein
MNTASGSVVAVAVALAVLPIAACNGSDHGVLAASSRTVSPCVGQQAATFTPFRLDADLLDWSQGGPAGEVQMRAGWRSSTASDEVVLQVADVDGLRQQLKADPGGAVPIDDKTIRVSLSLVGRCPDSDQDIEGVNGTLTISSLDTSTGGRISGQATFDLVDVRPVVQNLGPVTVLAKGATLDFDFEVRNGILFQGFTN